MRNAGFEPRDCYLRSLKTVMRHHTVRKNLWTLKVQWLFIYQQIFFEILSILFSQCINVSDQQFTHKQNGNIYFLGESNPRGAYDSGRFLRHWAVSRHAVSGLCKHRLHSSWQGIGENFSNAFTVPVHFFIKSYKKKFFRQTRRKKHYNCDGWEKT